MACQLEAQVEFPALPLTSDVNLGNHFAVLSSVPCKFNGTEDARIALVLCSWFIKMINYTSQVVNKEIEEQRKENNKEREKKNQRGKRIQGLITASLGVDQLSKSAVIPRKLSQEGVDDVSHLQNKTKCLTSQLGVRNSICTLQNSYC